MSDTVYVPPLVLSCQFQSIRWSPAYKVSTLDYDTLQLVACQQWWHIIHYSMDPDFQHRSSPQCHIQQDDLYLCRFPSLLIAVLHALPKIPNLVSSFHSDSAWNFKEQTSTGNSQAHHPLSLQSSIKSVYFRAFTFMWLHTIFFPWHVQLYCNQLNWSLLDCLDTRTSSLVVD